MVACAPSSMKRNVHHHESEKRRLSHFCGDCRGWRQSGKEEGSQSERKRRQRELESYCSRILEAAEDDLVEAIRKEELTRQRVQALMCDSACKHSSAYSPPLDDDSSDSQESSIESVPIMDDGHLASEEDL